MGLRVVQWATGGVGVAAIKGVLEHPDLELVGCWVHSPDKAGKDVGEIVDRDPLGVLATNSVEEILAGRWPTGRQVPLWDGHASERLVAVLAREACP